MTRYIAKFGKYYLEWSSVSDAPLSFGLPLKEFCQFCFDEYILKRDIEPLDEFQQRLRRAQQTGTSCALSGNLDNLVSHNRAGPFEQSLSVKQIKAAYCLVNPIEFEGSYWILSYDGWVKLNNPYIVIDSPPAEARRILLVES